jgi:hypothetical protein
LELSDLRVLLQNSTKTLRTPSREGQSFPPDKTRLHLLQRTALIDIR